MYATVYDVREKMPRLKDNLRKPAVTEKYRETKLQEVPHEQDIFSFRPDSL